MHKDELLFIHTKRGRYLQTLFQIAFASERIMMHNSFPWLYKLWRGVDRIYLMY